MAEYELLYIIPATVTDDDLGGIETRVKAMIEKVGATLTSTERLGKLRLAYPIKGVRHGHYVLARMNAEGPMVAKLDEVMRISTEILRHLILRADEVGPEKYQLVQFTEVNVDAKDEERQRRRREERDEKDAKDAATKEGAAPAAPAPDAPTISPEELEKKIDTALQDNA